jgi:hypothetical protein
MPEHNGVSYGIGGTRGGGVGACGDFHEFTPGADHMCACCRPAPNDPVIIKANKWLKAHHISTNYGSKAWGEGLVAWDKAGRP